MNLFKKIKNKSLNRFRENWTPIQITCTGIQNRVIVTPIMLNIVFIAEIDLTIFWEFHIV